MHPKGTEKYKPQPSGASDYFLANIEEDPGEQTNRASGHPDIVERLRKLEPPGGD